MGSTGVSTSNAAPAYSIAGWKTTTTTAAKMLEAIDNGAELSYVPGRFGGYILSLNNREVSVRGDWARKAIKDGAGKLQEATENRNLVYRKSTGTQTQASPAARAQAMSESELRSYIRKNKLTSDYNQMINSRRNMSHSTEMRTMRELVSDHLAVQEAKARRRK